MNDEFTLMAEGRMKSEEVAGLPAVTRTSSREVPLTLAMLVQSPEHFLSSLLIPPSDPALGASSFFIRPASCALEVRRV